MTRYRIALIEGDGIGPEVTRAALSALEALEDEFGLPALEILDIINRRNRCKIAVRGAIAEAHLLRHLRRHYPGRPIWLLLDKAPGHQAGRSQVLAARYRPLGTRGWVWGWRLGAGIIRPFGEPVGFTPDSIDTDVDRVPRDDRFRIGGVNSVRGYSENEISPVGGLVMLLGNVEVRVPVIGPFGLEAYADAGNVWARPAYIKASNLVPHVTDEPRSASDVRYVVGAGGRLNLPFGPLRLDFTWNLQPDHRNGIPHWLVHEMQFAIGPSF